MAEELFLHRDGETSGPYSASELKRLAREGNLSTHDLISRGKDGKSVRAGKISGLFTVPFTDLATPSKKTAPNEPKQNTPNKTLIKTWGGIVAAGKVAGGLIAASVNKLQTQRKNQTSSPHQPIASIEKVETTIPPQLITPTFVGGTDVVSCPFCGEEVKAVAKKCKHCGEILDVTLRAVTAQPIAPIQPAPPIVHLTVGAPEINIRNDNTSTATSRATAKANASVKKSTTTSGCMGCLAILFLGFLGFFAFVVIAALNSNREVLLQQADQSIPQPATVVDPRPKSLPSARATVAHQSPEPTMGGRTSGDISSKTTGQDSNNKYIPGLAAVDVYGNFKSKGFKLTEQSDPSFTDSGIHFPAQQIWRCTEENAHDCKMVEVFGEGPTKITLVRATYSNFSQDDTNESGRDFVAYVASIPYDGSRSDEAKTWAQHNFGKRANKKIGGVKFELIAAAPRVRTLLIQPVRVTQSTSSTEKTPLDAQTAASGRLRLAQQLLKKNRSAGRRWLEEIVKEYPDTEAAKEAEDLLNGK